LFSNTYTVSRSLKTDPLVLAQISPSAIAFGAS
jgi:hypothetical protein